MVWKFCCRRTRFTRWSCSAPQEPSPSWYAVIALLKRPGMHSLSHIHGQSPPFNFRARIPAPNLELSDNGELHELEWLAVQLVETHPSGLWRPPGHALWQSFHPEVLFGSEQVQGSQVQCCSAWSVLFGDSEVLRSDDHHSMFFWPLGKLCPLILLRSVLVT